jgi:zinc/manganese transport system ATP-binding protein
MLFARLLLQDASIILLDEPFTAIDSRTVTDLLGLVARWSREKRTVLAVLHDEAIVRAHFPRTLLLAREKIAWGATGDALTPQNLAKARAMAETFDREAPDCADAARTQSRTALRTP